MAAAIGVIVTSSSKTVQLLPIPTNNPIVGAESLGVKLAGMKSAKTNLTIAVDPVFKYKASFNSTIVKSEVEEKVLHTEEPLNKRLTLVDRETRKQKLAAIIADSNYEKKLKEESTEKYEFLDQVVPPLEWIEGKKTHLIQKLSRKPPDYHDLARLEQEFFLALQDDPKPDTPVSRYRFETCSQCMDELMRQLVFDHPVLAQMLLKVRNELHYRVALEQRMLYSTAAYALRKCCKTHVQMKAMKTEIEFLRKSLAVKNFQITELEERVRRIRRLTPIQRQPEGRYTEEIQKLTRSNKIIMARLVDYNRVKFIHQEVQVPVVGPRKLSVFQVDDVVKSQGPFELGALVAVKPKEKPLKQEKRMSIVIASTMKKMRKD